MSKRESTEINPVHQSIPTTLCQALILTGTTVTPEDRHACHCMKNKEKVIVKFKDRKQRNKSFSIGRNKSRKECNYEIYSLVHNFS